MVKDRMNVKNVENCDYIDTSFVKVEIYESVP